MPFISAVTLFLESVEEFGSNHGPHVAYMLGGATGRPNFTIPQEQLQYLFDYEISMTKIAQALGVCKGIIKQLFWEYGISIRPRVVFDDSELDTLFRDIQREFPKSKRVRESMHRTDPEGVAMRWLFITPRAVYSVRGPLLLRHIDGNHKLIR